jgi:hypothetical protein
MTNKPGTKLTVARFGELSAAYGSDLNHWPASEREAGLELVRTSDAARTLLGEERDLDRALAGAANVDLVPLSPDLERRLAEIPLRIAQSSGWPARLFRLWVPLAWSAAAALGVVLGVYSTDGDSIAVVLGDDSIESTAGRSSAVSSDETFSLAMGDLEPGDGNP